MRQTPSNSKTTQDDMLRCGVGFAPTACRQKCVPTTTGVPIAWDLTETGVYGQYSRWSPFLVYSIIYTLSIDNRCCVICHVVEWVAGSFSSHLLKTLDKYTNINITRSILIPVLHSQTHTGPFVFLLFGRSQGQVHGEPRQIHHGWVVTMESMVSRLARRLTRI